MVLDETEYHQEILRSFAPHVVTSSTLTQPSGEHELVDVESEMQLMSPSEPSELDKNICFRRSFEQVFRGRYESDGPIDRWLKMMTDETIVNNERARRYAISESNGKNTIINNCENVFTF